MSRAAQIARQQARAWGTMRDTVPGSVTMGGETYEVALVTGMSAHEQDIGVRLNGESVAYWLPKEAHTLEPALRSAVVFEGTTYYLAEVAGRGDMHYAWFCRAVRHLSR